MCCPLCCSENAGLYYKDRAREYLLCPVCNLVFVPSVFFISAEKEKARYDTHNNSAEDEGYRAFLNKLFRPLKSSLKVGVKGLDFGSGPGPTLSKMFSENGFEMDLFDPFYANNHGIFKKKYDFISASEVVEHLHKPGFELDRLYGMLRPRGILGVMTQLRTEQTDFSTWWYKNDETHICFFSKTSFQWLAEKWRARIEFINNDVVLIKNQLDRLISEIQFLG